MHLVALAEQKLRQIRSVLSGNAGDEGASHEADSSKIVVVQFLIGCGKLANLSKKAKLNSPSKPAGDAGACAGVSAQAPASPAGLFTKLAFLFLRGSL
jgi:hypothetical protein